MNLAAVSWRDRTVRVLAVAYVGSTVAVTLAALGQSTLLTPAGVATLLLAPLAVVAVLVGEFAIGLPWLFGLTDAEPDDHSGSWAYALGALMAAVNAGGYLWLVARHRRARRHPAADGGLSPTE